MQYHIAVRYLGLIRAIGFVVQVLQFEIYSLILYSLSLVTGFVISDTFTLVS